MAALLDEWLPIEQDAHTRLSQAPRYSGAIVVLFGDDNKMVHVSTTLPDHLLVGVMRGLLEQFDAQQRPQNIIIPH